MARVHKVLNDNDTYTDWAHIDGNGRQEFTVVNSVTNDFSGVVTIQVKPTGEETPIDIFSYTSGGCDNGAIHADHYIRAIIKDGDYSAGSASVYITYS